MDFLQELKQGIVIGMKSCFDHDIALDEVVMNETKKEFDGDFTYVLFPYVKIFQKSPETIGNILGDWMKINVPSIQNFNVVKGFLNLELKDSFWIDLFVKISNTENFGEFLQTGKKVLVEFSSPNTNKPLHLGHIRNILLGWSCSKILEKAGYEVIKTQVINDRGIAICKSMLAWLKYGNNDTPQSTGIKGDHFVGEYYVRFETEFVKEYESFQKSDLGVAIYESQKKEGQDSASFFKEYKNKYFNEHSILGKESKQMLLDWEAKNPEVIALWEKMNGWVYAGFEETYKKLGVHFDSVYYESQTYLLGKKAVDVGLEKGVFYRLEDSSVWIDLEDVGMDKKVVLRSDGTSVYITQDIGTAQQRYEDFGVEKMIYTVADEQDYHFKVLFEIIKRLEEPFADGLHHLSYGMVDLPTGRMKSREGTVVDADDLISEVISEAKINAGERGEIAVLNEAQQEEIFKKIGMAALKYFMIKVQPKKRMIFDPKESVDMHGTTGPYIQNAYVRIQSLQRKAENTQLSFSNYTQINDQEKTLVKVIMMYPDIINEAANNYDPSALANYCYTLAKEFHRFYHEVRILGAESEDAKQFRLALSQQVAFVISDAMELLGIEMVDRM